MFNETSRKDIVMSEAASNRDRDPAFEKVNDDNRAF